MVAPALQRLYDSLSDPEDSWLLELAQWYESRLRGLGRSEPPPPPEPVIEHIEPSRRERAKQVLSSIQQVYREQSTRLGEGDGSSRSYEVDGPTLDLAPPPSAIESREGDFSAHQVVKRHGDTAKPTAGEEATIAALPSTSQPADVRESRDQQERTAQGIDDVTLAHAGSLDSSRQQSAFTSPDKVSEFTDGIAATIDSQPAVPAAAPRPIDLPGYEIQGELGRGGMGVVYLARQKGIERPVALKMIISGAHAGREALARFEAEARAVGRFQHENIVRIYEIGEHEGLPYFSLEFVDGPTLSDKLREHPLAFRDAAVLTQAVAQAVDYAHMHGVIHRDLKPGNVLLTSAGVPKVADFGLAKNLEGVEELSQSGSIVGTPGYMAPEQARGQRDIGPAADVYGLGAILYCTLTGRAPFQGATATETLMQVLQKEPVRPSQLRPGTPVDLETICIKCLQKTPEARYPSAAALAEDVGRFLRGEPISARPISRPERVWRWCRRNPTIAIPTAAAAVLGLALMVGGPVVAGVIYTQKQSVLAAKEAAERNEMAAKEAEAKAETSAAEARAAKEEADANATEALVQQKLAVDALKSMTFEVQRKLAGLPELQSLRHQLIQVVQDGLQRMEDESGELDARNIIAAGIARRKGDMAAEIGQLDAALQYYRDCLDIVQELDRRGELPNRLRNLSEIHHLLAATANRAHQFATARQHAQKALEIRREWAEQTDGEDRLAVLENLAAALGTLAYLNFSEGHLDEAKPLFEESAALREKALKDDPDNSVRRLEWLGSQWGLARLDMQYGKLQEALAAYDTLIQYLDKHLLHGPQHDVAQLNRLLLQLDRGHALLYLGRYAEAQQTHQQALEAAERIAAEKPAELRIKSMVSDALYGLAICAERFENELDPQELLKRCREIRQQQLEADPEVLSRQVAMLYVLARMGDLEALAPLLAKVESRSVDDSYIRYNLAAVHALASKFAPQDVPEEVSAEHRADALDHLDQAIERGFRRYADLKHDPDLAAIRDAPEFPTLTRAPSGQYQLVSTMGRAGSAEDGAVATAGEAFKSAQ